MIYGRTLINKNEINTNPLLMLIFSFVQKHEVR
ncbi:hypothetical protein SAMN05421724_1089 [Pseudomonas syringae]|nr:hypothetical protein SAMN05421724_1089 [Pseudomonas syringae]